jgi:maleate isomerase
MREKMERCAEVLATADVDVVIFGCTTGSLVEGAEYADEIETRLGEIAGVPAVATAASICRAFDALGVESVSVSTPYPGELDEQETEFLRESGYDVTGIHGPGMESAVDKADVPASRHYDMATEIDSADADGAFISCTNSRTFDIIESLERDLGKPVVTSNQATLWDALRTAGLDHSEITGLGSLFETECVSMRRKQRRQA